MKNVTYAVEVVLVFDMLSNKFQSIHGFFNSRIDVIVFVVQGVVIRFRKPGFVVTAKKKHILSILSQFAFIAICTFNYAVIKLLIARISKKDNWL